MSKATWEMTEIELAKAYCEVRGIKHRAGGHFYTAEGKPFAQGWDAVAKRLVRTGRIKVGSGVNWSRDHQGRGRA